EDTRTLVYTSPTGNCNAGDTVTGTTSGTTAAVLRVPTTNTGTVVAGRLEITNASDVFPPAETLNCTSGGPATYSSLSATGPNGIWPSKNDSQVVNTKMHGWSAAGLSIGTSGTPGTADNDVFNSNEVSNNLNTNNSNGAGMAEGNGDGIQIIGNTVR